MPTLRTLARSLGLTMAVAGLAALPLAAQAAGAGDVASEIATAHMHATFSAKGKTLAVAHLHLYHVLNCLDGPKGKWFYPNQLNPCKGKGNGAIADATSHEQMMMLEHVAARAHAALMNQHYATVHHDAMMIAADLKKMMK